ncbi:putative nucleic-acid-binding protein containing a Zn-ribbon [Mycobacterium europaeum]|uniref:Putative nucleic-acid-binding protein containing a Zn-ribbon n=1 Tax=Mycobacterium europaeum TaxID=761804 RepID=A0A0U1DLE5_9MYCO|nr:OB-fold domain-containing protein [Mycobacterium europaeum]CQD18524.1 putative nucleic-acid-binding protein containing a Zn-ribbon [Mycobacterium europaeum]
MSALITEGLFRVDGDRSVLFGSRRRSTDVVKFPAERPELFDGTDDIEPIELSTEGTLYTYTTQEFAPPLPYKGHRSPEKFRPYVVGFVELPEGLLVEALIVGASSDALRIGQPMVSTTTTLETADGQSFLTYAFRPA